jgi:hypothetical protein
MVICSRARGPERQPGHPLALLQGQQVPAPRDPVVIEHRLHPLLPFGPLLRQRVPAADPGPEIEQMRGRDPRLRQPADQQQLPLVASIGPVGLGALLLALQRARLGRLREMSLSADPLEFLDHEPPARRRLQRHLEIATGEPPQELTHTFNAGSHANRDIPSFAPGR